MHGDGSTSPGRIDCYKRGAFVLESKRLRAASQGKVFDTALLAARTQAENYARALPGNEGRPPFVIVVDVGRTIEIYAEFTRSGGTYVPFPDPRSHRIALADLASPELRERLRKVWDEPLALDPARISAQVTRAIAAQWPEADFVVGNPPFIGNKRMRDALGDGYVEALRSSWSNVPHSADFVMYWWEHAATLARAGKLRRFGLITTNSLTMIFNRRVLERHLNAAPSDEPLSLAFAVADHPWVDSADGAAVRIAMTVARAGLGDGSLFEVEAETPFDDGEVAVSFGQRARAGRDAARPQRGRRPSAVAHHDA